MPRRYEHSVAIRAPSDLVWAVMSRVEAWPEWTPSVRQVVPLTHGELGVGSRVRIRQPGLPPAIWQVTEWSPGRQFTWVSIAPGVRVTAVHRVETDGAGSRVTLSLDYAGPLGGVLARMTHRFNVRYPELEANGLKSHCESLTAGKTPDRPPPLASVSGGKYIGLAAIWFALAFAAGWIGLTATMRPPVPQLILFASAGAVLFAFWRGNAFRAWILSLPPRPLVLPHLVRFIGIYFLVLHARGELPYAFAVPGGWGDIATATLALLVTLLNAESPRGRRAYLAWNILGLLDILFVLLTATRLFLANPDSMSALLRLPLSLLPTFFVPLILATHVMLFMRLTRLERRALPRQSVEITL